MATEITEFGKTEMRYGNQLGHPSLPHLRHTALALAGTLVIGADAVTIEVVPGEDVRINAAAPGAAVSAPNAGSMLLKAGVMRRFAVRPGVSIRTVAG